MLKGILSIEIFSRFSWRLNLITTSNMAVMEEFTKLIQSLKADD